MIDDKTVVMENAVIMNEAEILKSSIGAETFIDKYTRVEYSKVVRLDIMKKTHILTNNI